MPDFDVIVIGAGNAAMAAAVSAREQGAQRVVVLEKAPREQPASSLIQKRASGGTCCG